MVGPGALKPKVGDGIKSRRPLSAPVLHSFILLFFFLFCVCCCTSTGVYIIIIIIIIIYFLTFTDDHTHYIHLNLCPQAQLFSCDIKHS